MVTDEYNRMVVREIHVSIPSTPPTYLGVGPHEAHGGDPLGDGGDVDGPGGEGEGILGLGEDAGGVT